MTAIPEYGDLFTFDDFKQAVKAGAFIDYDGVGHWANEKEMSEEKVYPSDLRKINFEPKMSHVVWFNR